MFQGSSVACDTSTVTSIVVTDSATGPPPSYRQILPVPPAHSASVPSIAIPSTSAGYNPLYPRLRSPAAMEGRDSMMDFLDFDIPTAENGSMNGAHSGGAASSMLNGGPSGSSSMDIMMASNEKSATHVHTDAIIVTEDLFDDDDLS